MVKKMVEKKEKMVEKSVRATCTACKKDIPHGSYFVLKRIKGKGIILCEPCAMVNEELDGLYD